MPNATHSSRIPNYLTAAVLAVCVTALVVSSSAFGMDINTCADQIILSGKVENGDLRRVKRTLGDNPDISIVVLRNSNGGDAESGYEIGEYFREHNIITYLSGYCRSSCSRMFLGGKERYFTSDYTTSQTMVSFHSNYNNAGSIFPGAPWRLKQYVRKYSDGKADEALVERWVNLENRNGFAHFFHPSALKRSDGVSILLCQGTEPSNQRWKQCEKISGYDALSMGIITTPEIKRSCDADSLAGS